jgi:hypothetical protein
MRIRPGSRAIVRWMALATARGLALGGCASDQSARTTNTVTVAPPVTVTKELWFSTCSGYVPAAVECADERGIVLFTYSLLGELTPVSRAAQKMVR